jgi:hypothetical protein
MREMGDHGADMTEKRSFTLLNLVVFLVEFIPDSEKSLMVHVAFLRGEDFIKIKKTDPLYSVLRQV